MSLSKPTDIQIIAADTFFLPVTMRVPLKFGPETLPHVICLPLRVTVRVAQGPEAPGCVETPLSVCWAWPSTRCGELRALPRHQLPGPLGGFPL